ncbi:MAG TPA: NrsF family protein, partial [Polyangiales bacterium]|nr:NrsF family protein [Polyangiales bacterium]
PVRRDAYAHATTCASCARTLRESSELLDLIDRSASPMVVNQQLTARVKQAVFGEVLHTQPTVPWLRALLLLLGAALSAVMAWLDTKPGPWFGSEQGLHCVLFENGYALSACAATAVWARSQKRAVDPWTGSLVGMAGALLGQVLLRTHCDSAHAALHLFAAHVLGVLIGTALGALATPALTRPR